MSLPATFYPSIRIMIVSEYKQLPEERVADNLFNAGFNELTFEEFLKSAHGKGLPDNATGSIRNSLRDLCRGQRQVGKSYRKLL